MSLAELFCAAERIGTYELIGGKMKKVLIVGLLSVFALSNVAYASSEPAEFFKKYVELGDTFDPALAALYSDRARIHATRQYPLGLSRDMEFTGAQWKAVMLKVMEIAKAKNDKSRYSNMVVTRIGDRYKIKADRYSVLKCYTDTGYYMIVQPGGNEDFSIVEEYMETKAFSDC
jgi:hypothetical protein